MTARFHGEAVRSDLHVHAWSTSSDTPDDNMVAVANHDALEYVALVEHPTDPGAPRVADTKRVEGIIKHQQSLLAMTERDTFGKLRILSSVELSILPHSQMEVPGNILSQLDFVIAARHGGLNEKDPEVVKTDVAQGLASGYVDVWGHPTRYVFSLTLRDWRWLIHEAKAHSVAVEFNTSWPYDEHFMQLLVEEDVFVSVGSDIHHEVDPGDVTSLKRPLLSLQQGVDTLLAHGISNKRILNLMGYDQILAWLKAKTRI